MLGTTDINIYYLLLLVALGGILFVGFYILNNYILPLISDRIRIENKWMKVQLLVWIAFSLILFIELLRVNAVITLSIVLVAFLAGWSFWKNIFSGIIIQLSGQIQLGETIAIGDITGTVESLGVAQSVVVNHDGERVNLPNSQLRSSALRHVRKKSNIELYSFSVIGGANETVDSLYQTALNCPYISANQNIDIKRLEGQEFSVKTSIIDSAFIDQIELYFKKVCG
ncbi:MAG: small-conductance mechanosensitive channel [Flavobacteriaceae bacterium]|jgi:small-conductance mechanosensitive channel